MISADLHSCSSVYTSCPISSQTLTLGLKFRGFITNYIINQYKCLTSHFFQFIYNKVTDKHKRLLNIRLFKEIFPTCFLFYFAKYILHHRIYHHYIILKKDSFQNISIYLYIHISIHTSLLYRLFSFPNSSSTPVLTSEPHKS